MKTVKRNRLSICDAPFVMHDGFAHFALTYFTRPYSTLLLLPSGVLDDVTSITWNGGGVALPQNVVARMVFEILLKNDYAELNGMFAGEELSMHGQITRTVDHLRTNHRVCVLSSSTRLLQSIQNLRNDRREHAKGISCIRLSNTTNKPMIARWYDPTTYASSYVATRPTMQLSIARRLESSSCQLWRRGCQRVRYCAVKAHLRLRLASGLRRLRPR